MESPAPSELRVLSLGWGVQSFTLAAMMALDELPRVAHRSDARGRRMKAGSVFTGIGGLDLGFETAGVPTAWQIENARYPVRVLEARFPNVRRYADVIQVNPSELAGVDVLHGGFPCQDVSVAGRRAGLAGERSSLFHEFVRLAAALRPPWVVIENVPGLRSSEGGRDLSTVLGRLAELGYGWAYRSLAIAYLTHQWASQDRHNRGIVTQYASRVAYTRPWPSKRWPVY